MVKLGGIIFRGEKMDYIDLHTHTRYSDGTSTVENSLRCAEKLGLSIFSVADHNNVNAYDEIIEKREMFSGEILPATELNTLVFGNVIDVLGYGIDIPKMKEMISKNYLSFHDKQVAEAKLDTLAMLKAGVVLGDDFVRDMLEAPEKRFDPYHANCRRFILEELQRYPENARFFESREEFETIAQNPFTRKYVYNINSPLYCDQSSLFPDLRGVVEIIHACGGLAFLAHAFEYTKDFVDRLEEVAEIGLDGVECHYGTFTPEQKEYMTEFAKSHSLYMSGGSDFHGLDMRPKNIMGLSAGEKIPRALIADWEDKVRGSFI